MTAPGVTPVMVRRITSGLHKRVIMATLLVPGGAFAGLKAVDIQGGCEVAVPKFNFKARFLRLLQQP